MIINLNVIPILIAVNQEQLKDIKYLNNSAEINIAISPQYVEDGYVEDGYYNLYGHNQLKIKNNLLNIPILITSITKNKITKFLEGKGEAQIIINSFIYKKLNNDERVTSINGVTFNNPLIYSKNFSSEGYLSSSRIAIDGSSIVSVLKKAKYATAWELKDNFVYKDTIEQLFNSITSDIIDVEFNNGYIGKAKFNLLENPITATPLYEGSEYYNLTIRILV